MPSNRIPQPLTFRNKKMSDFAISRYCFFLANIFSKNDLHAVYRFFCEDLYGILDIKYGIFVFFQIPGMNPREGRDVHVHGFVRRIAAGEPVLKRVGIVFATM